nr:proline-rich protein PRCC [Ipomoea batatas]GME21515.1 proline-rich protein PRCC [Ipomoea batatas]
MDSLLANYASSEEEDREEGSSPQQTRSRQHEISSVANKPSFVFSLPPPKSSSSILSSLPAPKALRADPFNLPTPLASSEPKPKKTPSVKSFLSSLPVPKSSGTLGALSLGSGTSRRSILEANVPASDSNSNEAQSVQGSTVSSSGAVEGSEYAVGGYQQWGPEGESYTNYQGYTEYGNGDGQYSNWVGPNGEQYSNYASSYGDYGQVEHNWVDGSNASSQELPESAESALRVTGKRGRNDAALQIVEVKQDELMKNRPREDQVKLTGIAFGPAYKPASTKGKPTKLHKRKHQIGSLYFDMRQKETELAERRARGMLTKAQTQGKYGW